MSSDEAPRAVILGLSGLELTPAEAALIGAAEPLGFILFARNVSSPEQLRGLTAALRDAAGRAGAPIFIDQEGGRVARLRPPSWPEYYPARRFGALCGQDRASGLRAAYLQSRLIAHDLGALGIDVDCAPCLDLAVPGAHDVIGDRAFSSDVELIAALGRMVCDGLLDGGVLPVIKHLPGHGRAQVDSHKDLPRIDADLEDLRTSDFVPFTALNDMPIAMTAHIVYAAIDPDRSLTQSKAGIETIVRGIVGFDGVLISDDLNMQALSGPLADRAARSFEAGCDLALHCSGDLAEMEEVAAAAPRLSSARLQRWERAAARRQAPKAGFDPGEARHELEALLSGGAAA